MKSIKNTFILFLLATSIFYGCKKENGTMPKDKPFVATDYFIAGTISPKNGAYTSVYIIKLLEDNKATFMATGSDFNGDYTLTKDSLIVTIHDPENYKIAKFAINDQHQFTSAYYRALKTVYTAQGALIKIEKTNQLAGKLFKGEEFQMGPVSSRKDLFYKFGAGADTYGSGLESAKVNDQASKYEIINNSAFKYKNGQSVEMGFVHNKKLTVFRLDGLFYFGNYDLQ